MPLTGYGRNTYEGTDRADAAAQWVLWDGLLVSLHGKSADPVCQLYAGLLASWLTTPFGRPVNCRPYECHAKGDSRCASRTRLAWAMRI
jgi:hypothetical protein